MSTRPLEFEDARPRRHDTILRLGEDRFNRQFDLFLSRTPVSMVNEMLGKVLAHNICCVIASQCELGIEPVFWPEIGKPALTGKA